MPGSDDFLVSQRFREAYHQDGLTGLIGFDPVQVIEIKPRKSTLTEPPSYFQVCANYGPTALDLAASGFEWVDRPTCPLCRTGNLKRVEAIGSGTGHLERGRCVSPGAALAGETMCRNDSRIPASGTESTNAVFSPAEISGHDFYPEHPPKS